MLSTKLALDYEAIRRREYELINQLLDVLPRVDNLEEARVAQVRDAQFHADHPFLMVFVGPFSSGKSSLINALMGAQDLLPVGPIPTTDRITILRYGDEARRMNSGGDVDTVFYPSPMLKKVSFVDTPGLQSVLQRHEETTRRFLHRSDVVLMVMPATQAMTASNLEYLQTLKEYGKKVIILINQVDLLTPEESATVSTYVLEQSQMRLGYKPDVWLVSARRGMEARQTPPDTVGEAVGAALVARAEGEDVQPAPIAAPTLAAAGGVNRALWESSGLYHIEDYIDTQLSDENRLRQKLQTPLQILQNVGASALTAVRANQAALNMYQGINANLDQQFAAFKREQDKVVADTNADVRAQFTAAAERGGAAIRELFHFRESFNSLRRGVLELVGVPGILRRMTGKSFVETAFEKHKTLEPIGTLPTLVDKLGPRLEGRDMQDIEGLVKYAQREIAALPPTIRTKVIGDVHLPVSYDRTALQDVRPALQALEDEARTVETNRIQQRLRNTLLYLGVWEVVVVFGAIVLFSLWGQAGRDNGVIPFMLLLLLIALGAAGFLLMPLAGARLHKNYAQRLLDVQTRYLAALETAANKQVDYGMRLRREAVAPLTRLIEAQTTLQKEQLARLQDAQQEMVSIESALTTLGK